MHRKGLAIGLVPLGAVLPTWLIAAQRASIAGPALAEAEKYGKAIG